jgi:hypothetical protein
MKKVRESEEKNDIDSRKMKSALFKLHSIDHQEEARIEAATHRFVLESKLKL